MGKDAAALPPLGPSLAVLAVTLAVGLAGFGFFMYGETPFPGWLSLGVCLIVAWVESRSLPGLRERTASNT